MKRLLGKNKRGFTLFEILIAFSIIVLLILLVLINLQTQTKRARDAKRKTDLSKIQKAYEEYFNDKQCYPFPEALAVCGGTQLSPYIKKMPCDPVSNTPYLYVTGGTNLCIGYRACAQLEDLKDPDITRIGCDPVNGCGWAPGYNYCVSVGLSAVAPDVGDSGVIEGDDDIFISGTPTPTPMPGIYACSPGGECNSYAQPQQAGCPVTYDQAGCLYNGIYQCQFEANRCTVY